MTSTISLQQHDNILRKTTSLIALGRVAAARPLLAALRRTDGDDPTCSILEALLLVREGNVDDAVAELGNALTRHVDHVSLLLCRSEIFLASGQVNRAADDAARAVIADRANANAKATLGVVLLRMGRVDEALSCIEEAVADAPDCPRLRAMHAEARERAGDPVGAARALDASIARWPMEPLLRVAAMMAAMGQRAFERVVTLGVAARRVGVVDATIFGLLGHAYATVGAHDEAAEAYLEAQKLAPEDPLIRHMVAASLVGQSGVDKQTTAVETMFDQFADHFECHLLGLSYRIPGLIHAALCRHRRMVDTGGDTLDLGCGTGFIGLVFSDLAIRRIVGVDISARMLAHARAKNVYTELYHCEIVQFLREVLEEWDVVIAADVLTYQGPLDEFFTALRPRVRGQGCLIFSLEALLPDMVGDGKGDWRLQRQGRFCHSESYIRDVLHVTGFTVLSIENEPLRMEGGSPVSGFIISASIP